MVEKKEIAHCSFCGKTAMDRALIKSPNTGTYICEECSKICMDLFETPEREESKNEYALEDVPSPKEMKQFLDQYVIGQENAKKALSVAVYNHYKRLASIDDKKNDVEIQKSNILLAGPTGCGKTLLVRTLAKKLNVPFAIADATTLTETGYVGDDVENVLLKLLEAADFNTKKAECGIIYIDEIDKIAKKGPNVSISRDVSGEGVQQALLKIIEGSTVTVPTSGERRNMMQKMIKINTENILFICAGAFAGIDAICESKNKNALGFVRNECEKTDESTKDFSFEKVTNKDYIDFGLIPEFLGRLPVIVSIEELSEKDLFYVMTEPKNAVVKQYQKLLSYDGIKLTFEENAIKEIAKKAIEEHTGARGLKNIIEQMMMEVMYECPSDKEIKECIVTKESVLGKEKPIYNRRFVKKTGILCVE